MAKNNRIKNSDGEKSGKSSSKKSSFKEKIQTVLSFFKNEKFHRILGLALILVSVFLLIAFVSYFFTWRTDQDKVTGSWSQLLFSNDYVLDNWLGKFGAILSHQFMVNWFGVSSFILIGLTFLVGFKILFGIELLPFKKTFAYSLFSLVFISTVMGYAFQKSNLLFMGGAFGFEMNKWLGGTFGTIGAGLFIGFVMLTFCVIAFNLKFLTSKVKASDAAAPVVIPELETEIATGNKWKDSLPPVPDAIKEPLKNEPIELSLETEEEIVDEEAADEEKIENGENELTVELPEIVDLLAGDENNIPLSIESIAEEPPLTFSDTEDNSKKLVEALGEYDPTLDLSSYQYPTLDLLENHAKQATQSREELMAELEANKNRIVETLGHYNIAIDKIKATVGPTVTLFEIVPQAGIRISKIKNLEDDIALSLSALGIRIIAPIPGKGTIGIEVPNQNPEIVSMKTVIASEKFQNSEYDLPIGLGKTISNEVFVADLAKMPHLLMAGATGQGKSVGLNAVLASLLYKKHPSQVKFVLVDPKKVELTLFKTIERHFLAKLPGEEEAIITDTRKVVNTLNSLCIEMDQRYELLKDAQVRNIREYNVKFVNRKLNPNNGHRFLPFIVLVVDEFADLIMTAGKEVETPIARLAQLARAIGIHLIIATQRPSVNIITGTIKANFPARIAFRVTSKIDSRTILDTGGADQLIGRGDMLLSTGAELIRLQCAFVDTPEIDKITDFIGNQRGYSAAFMLPEYVGENEQAGGNEFDPSDRDPLFEEAARMVVQHQQGSASLLQRRLKLGYNRAGRLVDQLEAAGIIGPFEGSKAREVRIKDMAALEQQLTVNH